MKNREIANDNTMGWIKWREKRKGGREGGRERGRGRAQRKGALRFFLATSIRVAR